MKTATPYQSLYRDVFNLHMKFDPPLNTEGYWDDFIHAVCEVNRKHNNSAFSKDLLLAVYSEQERKSKEQMSKK